MIIKINHLHKPVFLKVFPYKLSNRSNRSKLILTLIKSTISKLKITITISHFALFATSAHYWVSI